MAISRGDAGTRLLRPPRRQAASTKVVGEELLDTGSVILQLPVLDQTRSADMFWCLPGEAWPSEGSR